MDVYKHHILSIKKINNMKLNILIPDDSKSNNMETNKFSRLNKMALPSFFYKTSTSSQKKDFRNLHRSTSPKSKKLITREQ